MPPVEFDDFETGTVQASATRVFALALNHPQACASLAVLDVPPTGEAWDRADARFALAYWPWTLLAQDETLPELVVQRLAPAVVTAALDGWGSPPQAFLAEVRDAYVRPLQDPANAHAICRGVPRRGIAGPRARCGRSQSGTSDRLSRHVLWSTRGPLGQWYADAGGAARHWSGWGSELMIGRVGSGSKPYERPTEPLVGRPGDWGAVLYCTWTPASLTTCLHFRISS
jgi:haloacetate dehalogenase